MEWAVNYQIMPSLQTGDIIFFSGHSAVSNLIKLITHCRWCHVGMVFLSAEEPKGLFCWESDVTPYTSEFPSIGVRMISLEQKINLYNGDINVRRIDGITVEDRIKLQVILTKLSQELKDRPYEKSMRELFLAVYDGPFGENSKDLSSIFCSELIAEAYQRIGLLPFNPPGLPSNEYTPADFARRNFKFLKGELTDMMPIKVEKSDIVVSEASILG